MRRIMLLFMFLMAFTSTLTTGCTTKERVVEKAVPVPVEKKEPVVVKEQTVVVKETPPVVLKEVPPPPPAPRVEIRDVAPSPDYIWLPGYWDWNGRDYVWRSGEWAEAPSPQTVWIPGHWEQTPEGYTWISGHWSP